MSASLEQLSCRLSRGEFVLYQLPLVDNHQSRIERYFMIVRHEYRISWQEFQTAQNMHARAAFWINEEGYTDRTTLLEIAEVVSEVDAFLRQKTVMQGISSK